jgi:single-strand DNA-binding protein
LLIGNLTRDPELRYTPQGTAVCTFGVATNRQWTTEQGEKKEETEFHTVVAWNRLAEICAEFLKKGRSVFVEGRISSREWETPDGSKRKSVEIVANEVIFLGGGRQEELADIPSDLQSQEEQAVAQTSATQDITDVLSEVEPGYQEEKPEQTEEKVKQDESTVNKQEKKEDIPF